MSNWSGRWSRREWLQLTALAMAARAVGVSGVAKRPLGVQLYSVRSLLPQRAPETLRALAAMGYREAEVLRADAKRIVGLARDAGVMPVSMHVEAPFVTGNWAPHVEAAKAAGYALANDPPSFERLVDDIRGMGLSYAVVAYLVPGERGKNPSDYRTLAEQLNRAGATARRAGVTLGYHNHGFEFEPFPDGQTGFDVLATSLDPAHVTLEVDVFWAAMGEVDPAALIRRLGARVSLLHLKDVTRGTPPERDNTKVASTAFAEVGSGRLDFGAILAAADAAGVAHAFVEQDQTPGDPLVSLEKSSNYLRSVD